MVNSGGNNLLFGLACMLCIRVTGGLISNTATSIRSLNHSKRSATTGKSAIFQMFPQFRAFTQVKHCKSVIKNFKDESQNWLKVTSQLSRPQRRM